MPTSQKHKLRETNQKKQTSRHARRIRQAPAAQLEELDLLALQRAVANPAMAAPANILALQRTVGNRAVQRLLAQRQGGENGFDLDDATASRINQARSRPVARQWDRALIPAAAGQTFSASARFGGTGVLQRVLQYQNNSPVPPGSIVACENPTFIGRRMVGYAGGWAGKVEGKRALLRHAAIVSHTPGKVFEAMGGGIKHDADDYMRRQEILVMDPPVNRNLVMTAARDAEQAGRELGVWWRPRGAAGERYHKGLAELAIEKGRYQRQLQAIREIAKRRGRLDRRQSRRWIEITNKLEAVKRKYKLPDLKKKDQRFRPTGHTYCVLFVIQCVQAAFRNLGLDNEADAWIARMGPAPHVKDLVERGGPWSRAIWTREG